MYYDRRTRIMSLKARDRSIFWGGPWGATVPPITRGEVGGRRVSFGVSRRRTNANFSICAKHVDMTF